MPLPISRHGFFFKKLSPKSLSSTSISPIPSPYSPPSPLSPTKQAQVRLLGRHDTTIAALDVATAECLRAALPPLQQEAGSWQLQYSTDQDGTSLQTMFGRVKDISHRNGFEGGMAASPIMLVVRDIHGAVFGAFLSEPPSRQKGYYGNGSCFLWRQQQPHRSETDFDARGISIFMATGENSYFVLSESGADLTLGGGDGRFGLWIDGQLNKGYSDSCSTYHNAPLATKPGAFQIELLELWSFNI
ncbi:hypothetical protein BASA81_010195 [Batrachochytrium salamandrivorans]|nr:hypothetical protein BASA81_010195 [Batrachochytrium salamandrivorans]